MPSRRRIGRHDLRVQPREDERDRDQGDVAPDAESDAEPFCVAWSRMLKALWKACWTALDWLAEPPP
jgi:hypothetical protein